MARGEISTLGGVVDFGRLDALGDVLIHAKLVVKELEEETNGDQGQFGGGGRIVVLEIFLERKKVFACGASDVVRGEIVKEDLQAILVGLNRQWGAIKVLDELLHERSREGGRLVGDGIGFNYGYFIHKAMITLHRANYKGVEQKWSFAFLWTFGKYI